MSGEITLSDITLRYDSVGGDCYEAIAHYPGYQPVKVLVSAWRVTQWIQKHHPVSSTERATRWLQPEEKPLYIEEAMLAITRGFLAPPARHEQGGFVAAPEAHTALAPRAVRLPPRPWMSTSEDGDEGAGPPGGGGPPRGTANRT